MSQKTTKPIWNLGSKYSRVSILQEIIPCGRQRGSCFKKSSKYLYPQCSEEHRLKGSSEPFPRTKFSAPRLPALPELCQKYFTAAAAPPVKTNEELPKREEVTIRLPIVQHHDCKTKPPNQIRNVGGGSISYEDECTIAKLSTRNTQSTAPIIKHYWNISGQERQRIISCPQHNLMMSGNGKEKQMERLWRIPARPSHSTAHTQVISSDYPHLPSSASVIQNSQRDVRTADHSKSSQKLSQLMRSNTAA